MASSERQHEKKNKKLGQCCNESSASSARQQIRAVKDKRRTRGKYQCKNVIPKRWSYENVSDIACPRAPGEIDYQLRIGQISFTKRTRVQRNARSRGRELIAYHPAV